MSTLHLVRMQKRLMNEQVVRSREHSGEVNIASLASFEYSSEAPDFPLEHLIDGRDGPGGTRWASARANTTECIVLEFDPAQPVSRLVYEVEERAQERTQEVRLGVSSDRGKTYREVLAQDYTFSPQGATFQREDLQLHLIGITHLKLTIIPNKGGAGIATLTCLQLFGPAT